jgi:hypothetical protein
VDFDSEKQVLEDIVFDLKKKKRFKCTHWGWAGVVTVWTRELHSRAPPFLLFYWAGIDYSKSFV